MAARNAYPSSAANPHLITIIRCPRTRTQSPTHPPASYLGDRERNGAYTASVYKPSLAHLGPAEFNVPLRRRSLSSRLYLQPRDFRVPVLSESAFSQFSSRWEVFSSSSSIKHQICAVGVSDGSQPATMNCSSSTRQPAPHHIPLATFDFFNDWKTGCCPAAAMLELVQAGIRILLIAAAGVALAFAGIVVVSFIYQYEFQ